MASIFAELMVILYYFSVDSCKSMTSETRLTVQIEIAASADKVQVQKMFVTISDMIYYECMNFIFIKEVPCLCMFTGGSSVRSLSQ